MIPTTVHKTYEKNQPGRILKCKGDDSEPMWLAETKEQLLAAFLALFHFNNDMGYYGDLDPDTEAVKEVAELEAQVSALKQSPILEAQLRQTEKDLKRARAALPHAEHLEWYNAALKGNVYAAFHLCHDRQDFEYEGFEMTHADNPLEQKYG